MLALVCYQEAMPKKDISLVAHPLLGLAALLAVWLQNMDGVRK
jgi:hypothetical protein